MMTYKKVKFVSTSGDCPTDILQVIESRDGTPGVFVCTGTFSSSIHVYHTCSLPIGSLENLED